MHEVIDIQGLCSQKAKILSNRNISFAHKKNPPELWTGYNKAVEWLDHTEIHSGSEKFPEKLFKSKSPNETKEQWDYRKSTYRPYTANEWNKALSRFSRTFNDQNFSLKFPDLSDTQYREDPPETYFMKDYPEHGSIVNYFDTVVRPQKVADGEAVICVIPRVVPTIKTEGDDGEIIEVIDQSKAIEPIARIYNSRDVADFQSKHYCLVLTAENSKLKTDSANSSTGLVFLFWDTNDIYICKQFGNKTDWKFQIEHLWQHGLDYLPVWKLKGIPVKYKDKTLYKPLFYSATTDLDTALYNWSTLQACIVDTAYPEPWEVLSTCDNCANGKISGDKGELIDCPKCKGEGIRKKGIFSSIGIDIDDLKEGAKAIPPKGYIQKDIKVLEFLDQYVEKNINNAFSFIKGKPGKVSGDETATGRHIDREDEFTVYLTFSNEIHDLMAEVIDASGKMRYLDAWQNVESTPPNEFQIKTAKDIAQELESATNLPAIVRQQVMKDYIAKRFQGDGDMKKKTELWLKIDSLATMQDEEIRLSIGRTISVWAAILHQRIFNFIELEIVADPEFLEKDLAVQKEALELRAKEIEREILGSQRQIDPANII